MADECGLSLLFAWSLAAQGMAAQQMFGVAVWSGWLEVAAVGDRADWLT